MTLEQHHILIHAAFDILAWIAAGGTLFFLRRTWFAANQLESRLRFGYLAAMLNGAGLGAWLFGTANAWLSDQAGFARSVEGALAGAIFAIEIYKKSNGIKVRTGAIYALPMALGIAVGRLGCLLSGLEDFTYGIPTGASWGWDFGDGILRHPVQLYESLMMAGFALVYVMQVWRGSGFWKANGFYLAVGFYALQRFGLELLKPYAAALAGLTLFQVLSLALLGYALNMITTREKVPA